MGDAAEQLSVVRRCPHDQRPGNNNKYKARLVSGAMLSPNMRIILTEKNELPKSRTATWAEIIELAKAQLIDLNDPMVKQRALVAIHRGDLSVEFRDGAADFKKAQRNIVKAIYSQEVPEPAPFDDLSIHIMAYMAYLKTDDFEEPSHRSGGGGPCGGDGRCVQRGQDVPAPAGR